jgi:type 1 fimbria pilin
MACLDARGDDHLEFQVQGAITPSCGLVAERIRIDLGSVPAGELGSVGSASPWHRSRFTGMDCIGATRASVTLRATPHAGDPRYLAAVGEARGVAIEMRSAGGQALPPDGTTPVDFTWDGGHPELGFEARYVRVGALQPGTAGATAQIQILWE